METDSSSTLSKIANQSVSSALDFDEVERLVASLPRKKKPLTSSIDNNNDVNTILVGVKTEEVLPNTGTPSLKQKRGPKPKQQLLTNCFNIQTSTSPCPPSPSVPAKRKKVRTTPPSKTQSNSFEASFPPLPSTTSTITTSSSTKRVSKNKSSSSSQDLTQFDSSMASQLVAMSNEQIYSQVLCNDPNIQVVNPSFQFGLDIVLPNVRVSADYSSSSALDDNQWNQAFCDLISDEAYVSSNSDEDGEDDDGEVSSFRHQQQSLSISPTANHTLPSSCNDDDCSMFPDAQPWFDDPQMQLLCREYELAAHDGLADVYDLLSIDACCDPDRLRAYYKQYAAIDSLDFFKGKLPRIGRKCICCQPTCIACNIAFEIMHSYSGLYNHYVSTMFPSSTAMADGEDKEIVSVED